MIIKVFLTMVSILMLTSPVYAIQIGDITMPDSFMAEDTTLLLNGCGWRKKVFIKLYACGLYLKNENHDPQKIIDADEPMTLRLQMVSGMITSEKMIKAIRKGFEKSTNGNVAPIKVKIDTYIDFLKQEIKKKDVYEFVYLPANGVIVTINNTLKGTITGLDFKKALFGIWLCDKPADKNLKKQLLGKK